MPHLKEEVDGPVVCRSGEDGRYLSVPGEVPEFQCLIRWYDWEDLREDIADSAQFLEVHWTMEAVFEESRMAFISGKKTIKGWCRLAFMGEHAERIARAVAYLTTIPVNSILSGR